MEVAAVDLVRRMFDLYEDVARASDPRAQGLFVELWQPDAVLVKSREPGSDVDVVGTAPCYRGVGGVLGILADLRANWDEFHVEIEEMRDLGDRVVVLARVGGEPRREGPAVIRASFVVTVRDGKIASLEAHLGNEALGVVPLQPSSVGPEWARLGSRLQIPATVLESGDPVLLGVADRWEIEAPVTEEASEHTAPGTPALVFFHDDGRLAGWYLPDVQLGVDLRSEAR